MIFNPLMIDVLIFFALVILSISLFLHKRLLRQIGIQNFSDLAHQKKAHEKLLASEEKFRTIFENSAVAITLTDEQEQIISWNKCAEQILGMTGPDLELKPVRSLYPPEEWVRMRSLNIRQAGSRQHLETVMIKKDQSRIDVDISISVLKDETGRVIGSIGVIQDITERKKAERHVKESEERFRTVFMHSAAAITLTDEKERIVSWNSQAERLLGKTDKDFHLKPIQSLYEPKEWKRIRDLRLRHKGPQHHFEAKMLKCDGSLIDADVSVTIFKDEHGRVTGSLGIIVDISERKKIEQELRQANEDLVANERALRSLYQDLQKVQADLVEKQRQLTQEHQEQMRLRQEAEDATKSKSLFLSNMSHEIRTPLNSILGFSQLLQKIVSDEKPRKFIDIIESSSQHLLAIINDILDFEKAISGRIILDEASLDLRAMIADIFHLLEHQAAQRSIAMSFTVNEKVPQSLFGDELKIRQIIINLLSNALKFTSQGSVALSVELDAIFDEAWAKMYFLRFKVSDTGIGMSEESLRTIFEQFMQADSSITRQYGGTGLGLSICKAYVGLMSGEIWVESELGKGSSFIFSIPLADAALTQEGLRHLLESKQKVFQGDRVLIAEPNQTVREQIQKILDEMQCVCETVCDGHALIAQMREKRYDICFLNTDLPLLNGVAAAKKIRNDIDKQIPLIAMGNATFFEEKNHCAQAGMDDFIETSISPEQIAEKLFVFLHKKSRKKDYSPKSC